MLRQVDPVELLDQAAAAGSLGATAGGGQKTLQDSELADVFGIDLEPAATASAPIAAPKAKRASKKATAKAPGRKVKAPAASKPRKASAKTTPSPRKKSSGKPAAS